MYIGVKKYTEFQFKLNQGKKLTKRVKILQKIENFVSDFCRPKNLFIFMFLLSCFTWGRVIVSRVRYIIQLLFTGSKSTISVFIVNFEHISHLLLMSLLLFQTFAGRSKEPKSKT